MDLAYDHIAEQSYVDRTATPTPPKDPAHSSNPTASSDPQSTPKQPQRQNLQTEFQETFKAFSASPWGAKLGGWWSNTRKQGEGLYEEAVREAEAARADALKGLSDLKEAVVKRGRGMSGGEADALKPEAGQGEKREVSEEEKKLAENESFIERFKAEAAKRLREVQAAEDAADEALLRFGTNIHNFFREAVQVSAPEDEEGQVGELLFESKDQQGKRVVHASRLDGQLYVIHTTPTSFTEDPSDGSGEWANWKRDFDVEKKTEEIARDLERYEELRRMMEGLVPEKVEYKDFWCRYYFLRMVLEAQESRRKELLKASANDTEVVGWDEDSDDEKPSTPQIKEPQKVLSQDRNDSSITINQPPTAGGLKPEGRRSHDEKSVADSEASYDIVSGAPSRAASSPKEMRVEESDEEDWE